MVYYKHAHCTLYIVFSGYSDEVKFLKSGKNWQHSIPFGLNQFNLIRFDFLNITQIKSMQWIIVIIIIIIRIGFFSLKNQMFEITKQSSIIWILYSIFNIRYMRIVHCTWTKLVIVWYLKEMNKNRESIQITELHFYALHKQTD